MIKRKAMKRLRGGIALTLTAALLAANPQLAVSANDANGNGASDTSATYDIQFISERISNNYSKVSAKYTAAAYSGDDLVFSFASAEGGKVTSDTMGYTGGGSVTDMTAGDAAELTVSVPKDGLYAVRFEYLSYDNSVLPVEFSMEVDGQFPFYECRNVELNSTWLPKAEKSYDRYNDEVVTVPDKAIQWESDWFRDSSYRHSEPLLLQLTAGEHKLRFEVKSGSFLLGSLALTAPESIPDYTGSQTASGNALIPIEGEDYFSSNESSVHAIAEYDPAVAPYKVTEAELNTIDSESFDTAGQTLTYKFNADTAGYYYIAMNYRQSDKTDFPVFLDVRVDGEIPNTAFQAYEMAYTSSYRITTLSDADGNKLAVYLEAGEHTVSYTITLAPICYVLEAVEEVMAGVNDLALEITKVAGTNSDRYRDLKLSRYIPGLENTLNGYADQLIKLEDSARHFNAKNKNVAVMSSMLIAANQLQSLADNPDEIPYRIAELSSSTNSVNQYLANTIDSLLENGLAIDRIWIYQEEAELPSPPGFFQSLWMAIQRFFASFFDQSYSASNIDPEHLQVWVNRSSQYVQVMQKMIDEYFTPATGIDVDISIMPDQYKLVLANSSGNAPDVATGINYTIPYELAIRGALVDMAQYSDFRETASVYEPGFFLTGTIGQSVYSMPETMNFWVLVYRTDVLEKLSLEVPDTIQDVIDMLPELQMRGLNFYYPTAGMRAMRNFHGTTPLIVQNGGALYSGTAQEGTTLSSEASVNGFTMLTDLFTVYDLPVDIDNFYQHFRNGDIPIGICDYGTYNLINNAAPELAGSWDISIVPGVEQADGSINRSTCGCAESTVIFKSDEEREAKAWEFIKWWSSTQVQSEFGQTIQITYGDEYMWTTANVEAFAQLPIDSAHKQVILEFAANVVDVARVPGTYMLEREMSNAFNAIVVDGDNTQSRLDEAVKVIDREIIRKLEEFGYIDSEGNTIKDYVIPDIDSIKVILGRN
ncbi:MAG: extracellular solute-binding protein [Oscillospiraceae bacterium]|nr:extracellular solute-binding protein [Oscillospiraceae bacterium]